MWPPPLTVILVNLVGLYGVITFVMAFYRRQWRAGTVYLAYSLILVFLSVFAVYLGDKRPLFQAAVSAMHYTSLFIILSGILYLAWWITALTFRLLRIAVRAAWRLTYAVISPAYFLLAELFTTLRISATSDQLGDTTTTTYSERSADRTTNLKVGIFALFVPCLPTILNRTLDVLPGTTVITNFLDLISLVLVTPKLFNAKVRAILTPFRTIITKLLAVIWLPYISLLITAPFGEVLSRDIKTNLWMMPKFAEQALSYEMAQTNRLWSRVSGFYFYLTMIVSAFVVCIILLNYRVSEENESEMADKALMWGIVVFVYSRALSIVG